MTFKIEIEKTNEFKQLMYAVAAVIEDEVSISVHPETGLLIRSMDKGRFTLIDLSILPGYFHGNFECDKEYVIGADIQFIKNVLQRIKNDDKLILSLDEPNQTLCFDSVGSVKKRFIVPLILFDDGYLSSPDDLELSVKITLQTGILNEFLHDAQIVNTVTPFINITSAEHTLSFSSTMDKKRMDIEIHHPSEPLVNYVPDGFNEAQYSVAKFKQIVLLDKLYDTVNLEFSTFHPIKISYTSIADVTVTYLLAPEQPETEEDEDDDPSVSEEE